ncbi:MAG: hypothetical protein F6K22_28055 [Okeania sp. SIO2F4]|nr:hypothetical protein [Okeania sp. SIO2F4]
MVGGDGEMGGWGDNIKSACFGVTRNRICGRSMVGTLHATSVLGNLILSPVSLLFYTDTTGFDTRRWGDGEMGRWED